MEDSHGADRSGRINALADRLLDILEEAMGELDNYAVKNKVKVREIEYENVDEKTAKPAREKITETEDITFIPGKIDRSGLKTLAAVLKALNDITQADLSPDFSGGVIVIPGTYGGAEDTVNDFDEDGDFGKDGVPAEDEPDGLSDAWEDEAI